MTPLDPDPLHVDDERIPSSKRYRLVPDSPRRGCSVLGFIVLASLVFVGSAAPRAAAPLRTQPWAPVPAVVVWADERQPGAPQIVTGPVESYPGGRKATLGGAPHSVSVTGPNHAQDRVIRISTALYSGLATWFPASGYQGAVPWWRPGQDPLVVAVSAFRDGRTYSTSVLVTGWCACGDRDGLPTVIDLSPRAFAELAPLSVGVVSVQVELPAQGPVLPATSTK